VSAPRRLLPDGTPPPEALVTPDAALRLQRLSDAEADLEAVMASQEELRVWCDGTWPEATFSLDENRADLAGHIEDAEAGVAYGYTIWAREGERVLGSLYLEEPFPFMAEYDVDAATRHALARYDVRVECWLRSDVDEATETRILGDIEAWLASSWPFERPCWGSRRGMARRRRLLEGVGLVEVAVLAARSGERRFHVHASPGQSS
jgi:hypothetical protein